MAFVVLISAVIIVCALSLAFKGSQIQQFMESPRESISEMFRGHGKKPAGGEKTHEKTEVGQSTGMSDAKRYFQVQDAMIGIRKLNWRRRKNWSQNDLEKSKPGPG